MNLQKSKDLKCGMQLFVTKEHARKNKNNLKMEVRILFFLYFLLSTPFLSFSQCPELKIEKRKWSDYFGYFPNHLALTNDSSSVLITGGVIVEWDSIRLNNQDSAFTHMIDNLGCRRDGNSFYQEIIFSDAEREIMITLDDCNYRVSLCSNISNVTITQNDLRNKKIVVYLYY